MLMLAGCGSDNTPGETTEKKTGEIQTNSTKEVDSLKAEIAHLKSDKKEDETAKADEQIAANDKNKNETANEVPPGQGISGVASNLTKEEGNSKPANTDQGMTNLSVNSLSSGVGETTGTLVGEGSNEIIFIGISARWNYQPGEQYDGSYDTTNSLFVLCSTNRCQKVDRSQIAFQTYASCDTAKADRIKLFKINTNGSINPNGSRIKVIGTKGIIKDVNGIRTIKFDPPTIKRIDKASTYNNPALQFNHPTNTGDDMPHIKIVPGDKVITGKQSPVIVNDKTPTPLTKILVVPDLTTPKVDTKISAQDPVINPLMVKDKNQSPVQIISVNEDKISPKIDAKVSSQNQNINLSNPSKEVKATPSPQPVIIIPSQPAIKKQSPVLQKMRADTAKTLNNGGTIQKIKR